MKDVVYKLRILSDEIDGFIRDVEILGNQTFFDLHNLIQEDLNWDSSQMASFFISNSEWEKLREVTLFEMDIEDETDSVVMDVATMEEFLKDEKQRLLYIYDLFSERLLFIELIDKHPVIESKKYPYVANRIGEGPEQLVLNDDIIMPSESAEPSIEDVLGDLGDPDEEDMRFENIDDYDL